MAECPICSKHNNIKNTIYEDNSWLVTHGPLESQILGYLYIEPKRHVENWSDFSDEELSSVGPLIKKLENAIKNELSIDRVYVVTISEAVRHLHFHIIPRRDGQETKGIPLIEQATQQKASTNEINENKYNIFIESIKNNLLI